MLAQGAKYQKRASFANDAARAKNLLQDTCGLSRTQMNAFQGSKNSYFFIFQFFKKISLRGRSLPCPHQSQPLKTQIRPAILESIEEGPRDLHPLCNPIQKAGRLHSLAFDHKKNLGGNFVFHIFN